MGEPVHLNGPLTGEEAGSGLFTYALNEPEVAAIWSIVDALEDRYPDPASPALFDAAWSIVPDLPVGLRRSLARFRLTEFAPAFLVTGLVVDDDGLGLTPSDVPNARERTAGRRQEYVIALIAATLGEAFNWSTLQEGRLIHDVIPIRGEETAQSGHGSTATLAWHTEDAFHRFRADYLLLLGLRNPDQVPTTVASIRDVELAEELLSTLHEPRFYILPDDEHIEQLARSDPDHPSLGRMRELRDAPPRVAVLFGDRSTPYLRIDPVYMRVADRDDRAERALAALRDTLEVSQVPVVLRPGDLLVIDNFLAVHGRSSFRARHDGTDRWLKKALVARDLRKSREHRATPGSRVLV